MLPVSRQWMWLLRVLVKINKDYRETQQVSSFTTLGSRRILLCGRHQGLTG
jgi:hypothetical protein